MRLRRSFVGAVALLCPWLVGPVSAAGTIVTDGATIAAGSAPTQGTVTIDASAAQGTAPVVPRLAPLGGIGTFIADLADADEADGSNTPFVATTSVTIAPGEYAYSTFDVASGAVVSCS